ncbi:hypothetical protein GEV33_010850 [Tenebrio molitor]|uniref:Uncharacterized protein n=1 Tax=Tenebrio molitor TaxID=7067 RepID=A0A8J6L8M1_TENMO|nr:hypothetical protein GEV33_010850 [Tenebrio molitor]
MIPTRPVSCPEFLRRSGMRTGDPDSLIGERWTRTRCPLGGGSAVVAFKRAILDEKIPRLRCSSSERPFRLNGQVDILSRRRCEPDLRRIVHFVRQGRTPDKSRSGCFTRLGKKAETVQSSLKCNLNGAAEREEKQEWRVFTRETGANKRNVLQWEGLDTARVETRKWPMLSFYWGRFRGHNMKSSNSGRHCKFYYSGLMGAVTVAAAAAHQSGRFCASLVATPERMTPQVVELVSCGPEIDADRCKKCNRRNVVVTERSPLNTMLSFMTSTIPRCIRYRDLWVWIRSNLAIKRHVVQGLLYRRPDSRLLASLFVQPPDTRDDIKKNQRTDEDRIAPPSIIADVIAVKGQSRTKSYHQRGYSSLEIGKRFFFVQPYAKRALCVPKTGREIGFRGRWGEVSNISSFRESVRVAARLIYPSGVGWASSIGVGNIIRNVICWYKQDGQDTVRRRAPRHGHRGSRPWAANLLFIVDSATGSIWQIFREKNGKTCIRCIAAGVCVVRFESLGGGAWGGRPGGTVASHSEVEKFRLIERGELCRTGVASRNASSKDRFERMVELRRVDASKPDLSIFIGSIRLGVHPIPSESNKSHLKYFPLGVGGRARLFDPREILCWFLYDVVSPRNEISFIAVSYLIWGVLAGGRGTAETEDCQGRDPDDEKRFFGSSV